MSTEGPKPGPIVFFGSPPFAVPTLAALVEAGWAPDLVVSQPARPAGRGQRERQPAVAAWAIENRLALAQPERVKTEEFLDRMRELSPWIAVVVAFGQIFPQSLLDIPAEGCINLHGSLLPRHRGAAPVHAAIAEGDAVTGVTTMQMERGLDSGPMLLKAELEIGPDDTTPELGDRLSKIGASLVLETLRGLARGDLEAVPQSEDEVTYARQLTKEDGRVDWSLPATKIRNRLRGYTPWPGLTAELAERSVKLLKLSRVEDAETTDAEPGTLLGVSEDALLVACGENASGENTVLRIESLQRPGKRAMSGRDLANGERLQPGNRFS